MKQIPRSIAVKQVLVKRTTLSLGVGLLCMGVFVGTSVAMAPVRPLAPPFYSFDAESATIDPKHPPVTTLRADDILQLEFHPDPPSVAVAAVDLGLGAAGDELDALSSANPVLGANVEFMLLFSIDRDSPGSEDPDPALVAANVPYNAKEQASKGHGAGDQYLALDEFMRKGGRASGNAGSRVLATSVQTRNQHNEGGTDFGGEPEKGSGDGARSEGPLKQDEVVSMMLTGRSEDEYAAGLIEAHFSATIDSPSLITLGGDGASIFYYYHDAGADPPTDTTTLFAFSVQLGLTPSDDIDAMIVFDTNYNHVFDGSDQVLFSLTPTSPSLATIPGHSLIAPAADVFTVSASAPVPSVFANADNLGLGQPGDNVDALDYFLCDLPETADAMACAVLYGIRGHGVPVVSDWGLVVATLLVLVAGALMLRRRSSRVA